MRTVSNLLSLSRVFIAPLTAAAILAGGSYIPLALFLFTIASATDFFDGYFARKFNTKTKLGAFLDPFADKVLVLTTFFAFYLVGVVQLWMLLTITTRDIVITLLRFLTAGTAPLVTSWSAKWKTTTQFFAIYFIFLFLLAISLADKSELAFLVAKFCIEYYLLSIVMYGVVGFTVWTGVGYVVGIVKGTGKF